MHNSHPGSQHKVHAFWSPWLAGLALGLVLLLTFVLTGHGLGATGASTRLAAAIGLAVAPATTQANGYFGAMLADGNPLSSWISWEVIGVAIGALLAAFLGGRFRVQLDGAHSVGPAKRLISALAGGVFAGFGARIAAGCTSGLGLSGAATFGIAAFVFLGAFFVAGLITTRLVRGI